MHHRMVFPACGGPFPSIPSLSFCFGGERGIRTLDTLMRYKLPISDRQYFRLRQQALHIISLRLWSAPAAELDSWIEVMSLLEVL